MKYSHKVILYIGAGLLGGFILNEVIPPSVDKRLGVVIVPDSCCDIESPINSELTPEKLDAYFKEKENAYIKEMEKLNTEAKLNRIQYDINMHRIEESYQYNK